MKWFSKILVSIALLNIAIGPAFAGNMTEAEKAKISQYRNYLEPMGYRLVVDKNAKRALVYDKNSDKPTMEIPFGDEENLRKFSPKSLNRMLLDEMVRVKTQSKAAFSKSLRELPTESLIFFVTMGAVVAGQLITDYSENPVAMKHHVDSQLSPVGLFGFLAFMASQGITSNVLAMYMTNPKFHFLIPYLGMTAGSFVQSYLSQVASDPNVLACGKVMLGGAVTQEEQETGIDADPCAKAYEYLVLKKKLWEYAPGMVSMIAASVLAGSAQALVTGTVLKLTGVDISLWLIPGAMELKGIRWALVKGLQVGIFVEINDWLSGKVTSSWKNFFDGNDFNTINTNLVTQVNDLKKSQWTSSNAELKNQLKNFRSKMTEWRMMNMSEIYAAHQAWSENIFQLTSMYNSSYAFYNAFVNEVRNARYNQQYLKPLLISYPLNGVLAKGLEAGKDDLYFQSPKMIENWQADTVADVVTAMDQFTSDGGQSLFPPEKKTLKAIRDLLASDDRMKIGEGLELLNSSIKETQEHLIYSNSYLSVLSQIRNALGHPNPMMEPGRGFLATFESAPSTAESLKGTPFYRQVGNFLTPHITDHLLMQMICGPDIEKGEKVVKTSFGYPSVFLPPQLKSESDHFGKVCQSMGRGKIPANNIYRWPIQSQDNTQYKGFLSYLVANARPSVVGPANASTFPQWWISTTEPQMQAAFDDFTKAYDGIVANMVRTIYRQDRESYSNVFSKYWDKLSNEAKDFLDKKFWGQVRGDKDTFNRGPISNGAINSAFQEERVYLSILNEFLAPAKEFHLDMATILKTAPTKNQLKEVEKQFAILNSMIQQIKVVQVDGHEAIHSDLENYQLEEQLQKIQGSLTQVASALGVGDAAKDALVKLTPAQQEVASSCLENLQSLAAEVMMYGSMANAVSWEKIRNTKQANIQQNKFNNEIQKKFSAMAKKSMTMPGRL